MLASTGQSKSSGPWSTRTARANKAWTANHKARLAITPTTAAVIPASAPDRRGLPRSRSTCGAPAKIHRKQGAKVTKVAISPPMRAGEQRIEHSRIAVGGEEADELE